MRTLTFEFAKRQVPILLDLCLPDSPSSSPLPIFIWWHGGGLIQGSRQAMAPHLKRAVDKYNIAVVSTDYRLAPQVRVPDIQRDMVDCFNYVIHKLPSAVAEKGEKAKLDTNNIVLSGSSAGGWQCLMVGLGMCEGLSGEDLEKRVKGIAAIYPITTMNHKFFLEKQIPFGGMLKDDPDSFAEFRDPNADVTANTANVEHRRKFYMHAQQDALFPSLLFSRQQRDEGWLQKTDVVTFLRSSSEDQRKAFPPIYIVHGEKDTAVDVDHARRLEKALKEVGTSVFYDEVPGRDHLWDQLEPEENLEALWDFTIKKLHA
ncbi:uncharacterized protein MEPE_04192 [Melanopsichium pennsylvanicum]|uniref:Alpha/beta hydrolase fold-3 domain-containing protein n=2 Tax=Melanopsichium pennsylvanicum TaxID=63383 RepID=A0AAJ5C6F4_9BASI|nr:alpha beta-hydrolase [Melanopsichium pennsylvanicum 4]SNX85483.1 uncharacterized protein MEPE_04192 [Melanopsichium pennsylvanicum]